MTNSFLAQITGINSPSNKFTDFATLPGDVISRILLFAIVFAGLLFFVRLLISGFTYLTSIGDPGKVQSASKNLINAILGLFIVATAFFLAQVIFALLGINASLV